MGLFGNSSAGLEVEIENATSEKNVNENWGLIMEICDKIGNSSAAAKESLRIIVKRLNNPDPHVVVKALTLLDACVKNCGKNYHLEIASRDFETEFKRLLQKSQPQIASKLKQCLKRWAEGDFKKDPQLSLIPLLYQKLKQEGVDFTDYESTPKREPQYSKDPNVVSSQQEEDDIARAIELSLKEKTSSPKTLSQISNFQSLYPAMNPTATTTTSSAVAAITSVPEPRRVRALYDFEAAEDNELTFKAGEMIVVTEESDPNWWRGSNHRGEGFFPANFVSADLTAEPEEARYVESKVNVKKEKVDDVHTLPTQQAVEINEEAIDRLLFLLHEADPKDPSQDPDEMLRLENMVNQMGPLIDSELERVDRKHAQLTQLSSDLIETINLYHSLMRETDRAPPMMNMYQPGYQMYNNQTPYQSGFQRMPPANMIPPPGMIQGMPGQHLPQMNNFPMPSGVPNNFHPATGPSNFPSNQNSMQIPGNFPPQSMPGHFQSPQNQMMPQMIQQHQQQPGMHSQLPQQQQPQHVTESMNQNQPQQQTQTIMSSQGPMTPGMMQQQMTSQQIPNSQPSQHPQQFQNPQQTQQPPIQTPIPTYPQQQNGMNHQANYPMNPNMQLSQMMGSMNLQSPPPTSMQNMSSMQPGMNGMQITQPMTFNLQDSNQNVPVYQQR